MTPGVFWSPRILITSKFPEDLVCFTCMPVSFAFPVLFLQACAPVPFAVSILPVSGFSLSRTCTALLPKQSSLSIILLCKNILKMTVETARKFWGRGGLWTICAIEHWALRARSWNFFLKIVSVGVGKRARQLGVLAAHSLHLPVTHNGLNSGSDFYGLLYACATHTWTQAHIHTQNKYLLF